MMGEKVSNCFPAPLSSAKSKLQQPIDHRPLRSLRLLVVFPWVLHRLKDSSASEKYGMADFQRLYERNAVRIHAKKAVGNAYKHCLNNVWSISFTSLSDDSI